jgi:hypothetical protein
MSETGLELLLTLVRLAAIPIALVMTFLGPILLKKKEQDPNTGEVYFTASWIGTSCSALGLIILMSGAIFMLLAERISDTVWFIFECLGIIFLGGAIASWGPYLLRRRKEEPESKQAYFQPTRLGAMLWVTGFIMAIGGTATILFAIFFRALLD